MISFFRNSDNLFFVVEHKNEFSESEVDRLEWLFSGSKLLKENKYFLKFSPDLCNINLDSKIGSSSIFLKPFVFKVLIILL